MKKKIIKFIAVLIIMAAATLAAFGCSSLDVVGKDSVRAFGEVLEILPAEKIGDGSWTLTAPDGEARLEISNDALVMAADAKPFINAGLDLSKLDNESEDGIVFLSPGFDMLNQNIETDSLKQFERAVKALRGSVGYHSALDHYNVEITDGNLFEWAKDVSTNDKDIVFVLNPEPLIAAGVDPNAVEGWVFAKVTVEINGKPTEVDKFLKALDIDTK